MPRPTIPTDGWRQIELARAISLNQGQDPDEPVLRLSETGRHSAVPAWQRYWTHAGALQDVLEGRAIPAN